MKLAKTIEKMDIFYFDPIDKILILAFYIFSESVTVRSIDYSSET